jgi:hypothetical protein
MILSLTLTLILILTDAGNDTDTHADTLKEWCNDTKTKYHVVPQQSWGQLPPHLIETWRDKSCDVVFTLDKMTKIALATCPADKLKPGSNLRDKKYQESLPQIAIMAASTTRKIKNPSPDNIALFTYMLPSLIRTIDCNFRYVYVLGYDAGDPFYDSEEVS